MTALLPSARHDFTDASMEAARPAPARLVTTGAPPHLGYQVPGQWQLLSYPYRLPLPRRPSNATDPGGGL